MGSDEAQRSLEADADSARREVPAEEATYAGTLAASETVERASEARSGVATLPLRLQGLIAEIHLQAKDRSRRAQTT